MLGASAVLGAVLGAARLPPHVSPVLHVDLSFKISEEVAEQAAAHRQSFGSSHGCFVFFPYTKKNTRMTKSDISLFRKLSDPQQTDARKLKKYCEQSADTIYRSARTRAHTHLPRREREEKRGERVVHAPASTPEVASQLAPDMAPHMDADMASQLDAHVAPDRDSQLGLDAQPDEGDWEAERGAVAGEVEAEISAEKQSCLLDMRKYTDPRGNFNYATSKEFTMEDNLQAMQFECNRFKTMERVETAVVMGRQLLLLMVKMVCFVNTRFLKDFIHLRSKVEEELDWEDVMKESVRERKEYDGIIGAIYKKHWRSGAVNPWVQFGFMMSTSIGGYHMEQMGKRKRAPAVPGAVDNRPIMARYSGSSAAYSAPEEAIAVEESPRVVPQPHPAAAAARPAAEHPAAERPAADSQAQLREILLHTQAQLRDILQQQQRQAQMLVHQQEQNEILRSMSQALFTEVSESKRRQQEVERQMSLVMLAKDAPATAHSSSEEEEEGEVVAPIVRHVTLPSRKGKKQAVVSVCLDPPETKA